MKKQAVGQSGKNVDRVELSLVYLRSGWNGGSRREVVEGEGRSPALKATESTLDSILSIEGNPLEGFEQSSNVVFKRSPTWLCSKQTIGIQGGGSRETSWEADA